MVNLNIQTVIIHLVFFLVMVLILNRLLFKPMLQVMDKRKSRVEGNQQDAEAMNARTETLVKDYHQKMEEAKKKISQEKEGLRKVALAEEDKIIKAARVRAGDAIAELRERIAVEFREAQGRLKKDSEQLGREVAARLLGRAI